MGMKAEEAMEVVETEAKIMVVKITEVTEVKEEEILVVMQMEEKEANQIPLRNPKTKLLLRRQSSQNQLNFLNRHPLAKFVTMEWMMMVTEEQILMILIAAKKKRVSPWRTLGTPLRTLGTLLGILLGTLGRLLGTMLNFGAPLLVTVRCVIHLDIIIIQTFLMMMKFLKIRVSKGLVNHLCQRLGIVVKAPKESAMTASTLGILVVEMLTDLYRPLMRDRRVV
jgi:hypothetical protein